MSDIEGVTPMGKIIEETTSIPGSWPLEGYAWKTEQLKLMERFLPALKEKKFLGLKCPCCGVVYCPPKPICRCLCRPVEWVEVGKQGAQEGVVTTFTFTGAWSLEGKPSGEGDSLIVVGVKLDGADTMMVCMLDGAVPEDVDVGMRVRMKWPEVTEGKLSDMLYVEPV